MPKKQKKKIPLKEKKEQKKEAKKTSSSSSPQATQTDKPARVQTQELPPEVQNKLDEYAPVLELLGIGPKQIEFYIKLPQIMDAVATHMQQLEQRMDQLIGKAPALPQVRASRGSKPTAPGLQPRRGSVSFSPPGAAPQGLGWIGDFIKTPEGTKLATSLINAFTGTGETGTARSNTIKVAEAIEKSVLDKTLDLVKKATQISEGFKDEVRKP